LPVQKHSQSIQRGQIWNVQFNPQVGSELGSLHPAVVMNISHVGRLPLYIVVPITTGNITFHGTEGGADVLASVIQSLGELKDEGALSRIRQIAKTSVGSDRLDMRRNAIRAWISIGGDHELPEIKRDLDDMRHSQATYVSTTYVDSVASLRTSAAVNLLKEFIQENPKTWLTPEIKAALERNNLS